MLYKDFSDSELEEIVREIENFNNDPSNWGEKSWEGNIEPLSLWEWAESRGRIDVMATIANVVAIQVITDTQYNFTSEIYRNWVNKFTNHATVSILDNQPHISLGFLEALIIMNVGNQNLIEKLEKIVPLYQKLGNLEKAIFYMTKKAELICSLLETHKLKSSEDEIWKILIETYTISKTLKFNKGLALALGGLGRYLGIKKNNSLALKTLYQAKLFSNKAGTVYGIPIIEEIRKIRDRSNIPASEYEIEIDPDILVEEFLGEVSQ